MSRFRMGIDIGGTFTDLCVLDEEQGEFINLKVPTTPKDLTEVVMETLSTFFGDDKTPDDLTLLFHATTVATNALLEQKGANTSPIPSPASWSRSARPSRSPNGWIPRARYSMPWTKPKHAGAWPSFGKRGSSQ